MIEEKFFPDQIFSQVKVSSLKECTNKKVVNLLNAKKGKRLTVIKFLALMRKICKFYRDENSINQQQRKKALI